MGFRHGLSGILCLSNFSFAGYFGLVIIGRAFCFCLTLVLWGILV